MLIHGQCHCGNIVLELQWRGDPREIPARACACSFCVKHGGVWTAHPGSKLAVTVRDPALVSRYEFGTRTAAFHVCSRCGCVPLATSEIDGRSHAVVNVNALEGIDAATLRRASADFDGEDLAARLARRARNWIADVSIVSVVRTALDADVSRSLIGALNAELRGAYAEPGANHFQLDPEEVAEGRGAFLVVYRAGAAVGCGALRVLTAGTAELKRMYVAPDARGAGMGRRLLHALEQEARSLGVQRLVLETGVRQESALALYRASGFEPIPLFGEYLLSPDTSVCLGKDLPTAGA